MDYKTLKGIFRKHEKSYPKHHLTAHITFSSFGLNADKYEGLSRIYAVSSDNKAFQHNKGGYSIFASCLDGKDPCVRLDQYMAEERGGEDGWGVEDCCIIGWLLSAYQQSHPDYPPELKEQKLYYSNAEIVEAMVRDACDKSGLLYEDVKAQLKAGHGRMSENNNHITEKFANVKDTAGHFWTWDIRTVRIYGPTSIVFENRPHTYQMTEVHGS